MSDNCKFCSICDQGHISKESVVYCSECDQAFCDQCKNFHQYSNSSKYHSAIPISDLQNIAESVGPSESYCTEHDEVYHFFCQSHNKCLCLTCFEEHKKCNDTMRLTKLTKDIQTSEMFREVKQGLTDIENNIVKIETHLIDNLSSIQTQRDAILDEISKMREKINDHLDNIEQKLRKDVSDFAVERINAIEITQELFKERKSEVAKYQKQMDDMVMYGSELQTFLNLRNMSTEIIALEQFLQSMADGESLNADVLTCNMVENLDSVLRMKNFGFIKKEQVHNKQLLQRSKSKQAQLIGGRIKTIDDIKIRLIKKVENLGENIKGCCILPDGKMVFCDFGNRDCIVICDYNGKYLYRISMKPNYAFDVTCIDGHVVAVTSGYRPIINIVDINTKKIIKNISSCNELYAITYTDGLFFCCAQNGGIQTINATTHQNKTIVKCDLNYLDQIVSLNRKIYYTNTASRSVICCDTEGKTLWIFNNETILNNPCGISANDRGEVYVTSKQTHEVVVLSADGKNGRKILSKNDGLLNPISIYFNNIKQQFLVSDTNGNACLFDVSL